LNLNNNITRFNSWELISFAMEDVFLTGWCTLINLNFKNFLFLYNFFTIAGFALIFFVNLFTSTTALITRSGSLRIHTRSKHLHYCSHTFTITSFTALDSSSFTSFAFTFTANTISTYSNLSHFTIVKIF
jgi:hypothetical protein